MRLSYSILKKELEFIRPAKTSRNTFTSKSIYILVLKDDSTGRMGYGEAAPLEKLSPDHSTDLERIFSEKMDQFCLEQDLDILEAHRYPSMRFALESAMADLRFTEPFKLFDTPFSKYQETIPINGLVWMAGLEEMYTEALEKIEKGFNCIKFKVGAHDFDAECRLLEKIRKDFNPFKLEIRLDANGAFDASTAHEQLSELKRFGIHSIEQPIRPKQWDSMADLCSRKIIPIALDEELIGVNAQLDAQKLLKEIHPQFIILKPTLIGGFMAADHWIQEADKLEIGYWATSALEGNIGLNAIAQWISQYPLNIEQGLGTGALFKSNIELGLKIVNGRMQRIATSNSPVF